MAKAPSHPLDPLSSEEISQASDVVKADSRFTDSTRFLRVALQEPDKDVVRGFDSGAIITYDRQAEIDLFDLETQKLARVVVDLDQKAILVWEPRDGSPGLQDEEKDVFEPILMSDERWLANLNRRGIDPTMVKLEYGSGVGYFPEYADRSRLVFAAAFQRAFPEENYYAHPIDGLAALIDVTSKEVLEVFDDATRPPVPAESGDIDAKTIRDAVGETRSDLRPLDIVQPEGPSFELNGNLLEWQKWRMRIGFHPVEGLVLHRVAYDDDGDLRPILYRAALSEMVVPYADKSVTQFWRAVFDAGEVGLGAHANALELGCDCLGVIQYLDAVVADGHGNPKTLPNAVCVHEEDFGVAWKHDGIHVGTTEVRRHRRLVVSFFATIGNYDYGFYWYFYTDGTIEAEVKLTGIIYTGAVNDDVSPEHGELVAPNLYGPHHQHLFCFRLDFEVDGASNSVSEVNVEGIPTGEENPYGGAFRAVRRVIEREDESGSNLDLFSSRYWTVESSDRRNRLDRPTMYKLAPQYSPVLFANDDARIRQTAGFASKSIWVTKYDPRERYAAGDHPTFGDKGLTDWITKGRSVVDEDVVVWHTVGTTHIVRPEDWPVMPVERIGFALKPLGFFDRNPALDLPAEHSERSVSVGHSGHGGAASCHK